MTNIPLGWSRTSTGKTTNNYYKLTFSRYKWLYMSLLPENIDFRKYIDELISDHPKIVIRGCSEDVRDELINSGFKSVLAGQEATLSLPLKLNKKSLNNLVKRGNRAGYFKEKVFSVNNKKRLIDLENNARHSSKNQLEHLFQPFSDHQRLFIIERNDKWLAAIAISKINDEKMQLEQMFKRKKADNGLMEALIYRTAKLLAYEGFSHFSLGEVPFAVRPEQQSYKSKIIKLSGSLFDYAYNYKSLYSFKNKFDPEWRNVFICGFPDIPLVSIAEIAIKSKYLKMVYKETYKIFKKDRIY